jgi:hypothetical protein
MHNYTLVRLGGGEETMLLCSEERPWGVHGAVYNDEACSRCGWVAPGPIGDARLEALEAAEEAERRAGELGWTVIAGGGEAEETSESLAA